MLVPHIAGPLSLHQAKWHIWGEKLYRSNEKCRRTCRFALSLTNGQSMAMAIESQWGLWSKIIGIYLHVPYFLCSEFLYTGALTFDQIDLKYFFAKNRPPDLQLSQRNFTTTAPKPLRSVTIQRWKQRNSMLNGFRCPRPRLEFFSPRGMVILDFSTPWLYIRWFWLWTMMSGDIQAIYGWTRHGATFFCNFNNFSGWWIICDWPVNVFCTHTHTRNYSVSRFCWQTPQHLEKGRVWKAMKNGDGCP